MEGSEPEPWELLKQLPVNSALWLPMAGTVGPKGFAVALEALGYYEFYLLV